MKKDTLIEHLDSVESKLNYAVADLRHLYDHMVNDNISDIHQAAKGLVAPGIKRLEELQRLVSDLRLLRSDEIGADGVYKALLEVIAMNAPRFVVARAGDQKMIGWFVAHTMKHMEFKANPQIIHKVFLDLLALPGWPDGDIEAGR